jgi:hypothetical protein
VAYYSKTLLIRINSGEEVIRIKGQSRLVKQEVTLKDNKIIKQMNVKFNDISSAD